MESITSHRLENEVIPDEVCSQVDAEDQNDVMLTGKSKLFIRIHNETYSKLYEMASHLGTNTVCYLDMLICEEYKEWGQ